MDPLLTRRQTLQSLAFSAVFGGSLLGLIGCGGGGRHGGGSSPLKTQTTRIPVVLPAGFSIPVSDLEGGTSFGAGTVDATGFSAKVNASAPTFAYLRQRSTGKLILYGLVGNGRPGVTPLGTAALSMAFALGLTGLTPEAVTQGMALLEADSNVTGLASTIESALASDPYAVSVDNAGVATAMKAAFSALSNASSAREAQIAAKGRAQADPIVQVEPSDAQYRFRIDQGETDSIVPTNVARRPAAVYTYQTGHVPATDAGIKRIDQQDLEPTTSLIGSLATLGASAPFAPVEGKAVSLPVSGEDDKTLYETIVLFPAASAADPDFFGEAKYAGEVAEWKAKRADLNEYSFFYGILVDIFKVAAGVASAAVALKSGLSLIASHQFAAEAAGQAVIDQAVAGEFGTAISQALRLAAQSDAVGGATRSIIRAIVTRATGAEAAAFAETGLIQIALAAGTALAVSGAIVLLGDAGASFNDLKGLPQGVRWTETALQPKIKIDPRQGEIRQGGSLSLSVDAVAISGANLNYTWTLTGSSYGTLTGAGGDGGSGKTITTTGTSVTLATTPSDPEGQVVTVSVEAKDKTTGKSLGTDAAKIKVVGNQPVTESGTFTILTAVGDNSHQAVAIVQFAEVKGATYYAVYGTGGYDSAYWRDSIELSYNPKNPGLGVNDQPLSFAVGLSGGAGGGTDNSGLIDWFHSRFDDFTFTVTAYFGS